MNILLTTLGTSWAIVPELIGFTNPGVYNLYKNHPEADKIQKSREEYGIEAVDEFWIVTTNGKFVSENFAILDDWKSKIKGLPRIRLFSYKDLVELNSLDEIAPMSDLIYRAVLHAKKTAKEGKLYLSLAGGRKNMSADVQNAANMFGCDALLHVMDDGKIDARFDVKKQSASCQVKAFTEIPGEEVKCFHPIILQERIPSSAILFADPRIEAHNFVLKESRFQKAKTDLFAEIQLRQKESANSLFNIYKKRVEDSQTTYSAFQLLQPEIVEQLQNAYIGEKLENKENDLEWLQNLPKAELHCHFGGILSPEEMIEVARENKNEIEKHLLENYDFSAWIKNIQNKIESGDVKTLLPYDPKNNIKNYWLERGVPEPVAISAFILCFENKDQLLQDYIYNSVGNFKGIGIEAYEKLGDLQGSSLLQNKESISKTCQLLRDRCEHDKIRYMEVRCSPMNYTRGGLNAEKVVEIMMDELNCEFTIFKLIFIASRHGADDSIKGHIDLALDMRENNREFSKMFVGFDLAGAEAAKRPEELREVFMNVLERSIPTTIHAGEDMPVKSIWEAVYHLSAERIGHGLSLNEDESLKKRFKERKIAIELCPSSNDQIIGYNDFLKPLKEFSERKYPLKEFLNDGLKITINTDDPGMSLTMLSQEYYKAACMTEGGLSKWDILKINRNGFKYAFLPSEEKKDLLLEVETYLFDLLNE